MKHTYLYTLPESVSPDTWAIGRYYGQVDLGDPLLFHESPAKYLAVQDFLCRFTDMVMAKLGTDRVCIGQGYVIFGAFKDDIRDGTRWEVQDITRATWDAPYMTHNLADYIMAKTRHMPHDDALEIGQWAARHMSKRVIPVWM